MQLESADQGGIFALLLFHSRFIRFDDVHISLYAGASFAGRTGCWHHAADATRRMDAGHRDRADGTEPANTDAELFYRRIGPEPARGGAGLHEYMDGNHKYELLAG